MEKPKFVYVTLIATTPEKLWAALTSPEFTTQYWMGVRVESDWRVDSPVSYRVDGRTIVEGKVLKTEPPRLLAYTFHHLADEEMRKEEPSRVTYEIEPVGGPAGLVRLTVTHDDFPSESGVFKGISNGWPAILSSLKTLLETGQAIDIDWMKCGHD